MKLIIFSTHNHLSTIRKIMPIFAKINNKNKK